MLNPHYALENLKGGGFRLIDEKIPSIQAHFFTGREILSTFLFEWAAVQAPNAKQ